MGMMIIKVWILIVLLSIMSYIANLSAQDDYAQIRNHEYINHKKQWLTRATITFLLVVCLATFYNLLFSSSWILIGYYSLIAAFWFSIVFRYKLNSLRQLPIDYISKSNIYDSIFITLANKNGGKLVYTFELVMVIIFSMLSLIQK